MTKVRASVEELQNQIASVQAEADQLDAKSKGEAGLSDEEKARFEELVAQLEQLQANLKDAATEKRFAQIKERNAEPTRPAPRFSQANYAPNPKTSAGEALGLFLKSRTAEADLSPEAHYKMRSVGLNLGGSAVRLPLNYRGLNLKNRTILSKGGSGTGADFVWQSFSDKVVEYLTYSSPLVGLVASETTGDANLRTYFRVNDTSMISTYTTDSSGTETNPTIPDTNLGTGKVQIGCFDITSGYQKVTFNELRDSYVGLEDKIAKANANSHARKIEREIILASGNGTTGVQGIEAAATALTGVDEWSVEALEGEYFSVPAQYRKDCIWLMNGDTYGALYTVMKDSTGRSLFDKTVEDSIEYDVLMGKKVVVSDYVTANKVVFMNPDFYQLRMVDGQIFQMFEEKFFPNIAWAGVISFGGAYIGPPQACKSLLMTPA